MKREREIEVEGITTAKLQSKSGIGFIARA